VGERSVRALFEWYREGCLLEDKFSVHAKEENVMKVQCAGVEVDFIPA
jgi:hypothetical protein